MSDTERSLTVGQEADGGEPLPGARQTDRNQKRLSRYFIPESVWAPN